MDQYHHLISIPPQAWTFFAELKALLFKPLSDALKPCFCPYSLAWEVLRYFKVLIESLQLSRYLLDPPVGMHLSCPSSPTSVSTPPISPSRFFSRQMSGSSLTAWPPDAGEWTSSFVSLAYSLANMLERLYHCFLSVPGLGLGLQSCTKLVVVKSSPSGLPPAICLLPLFISKVVLE